MKYGLAAQLLTLFSFDDVELVELGICLLDETALGFMDGWSVVWNVWLVFRVLTTRDGGSKAPVAAEETCPLATSDFMSRDGGWIIVAGSISLDVDPGYLV